MSSSDFSDSDTSSVDTDNNDSDSVDIQTKRLQQYVALLLSKSSENKMAVSSLALDITESFDQTVKQLTGMDTRVFFEGMEKRKIIDIESGSGKHRLLKFAVLKNQKSESNQQSDSDNNSSSESDEGDSTDNSNFDKKRKLTNPIESSTKRRKLNEQRNESAVTKQTEPKQRHKGTVKLFMNTKGYGFIGWSGGDDVWFHRNDVSEECKSGKTVDLHDGDAVEFEVGIVRGKRNALNITMDPDVSRERVHGVVRKWQYAKGFGFIKRDDDSSDVFVHRDNLLNGLDSLQKGNKVEFEVIKDSKTGKATAVRVRKVSDDTDKAQNVSVTKLSADSSPSLQSKKRHKGTVKRFMSSKGFGFIGWSGGKDLYFRQKDISKELRSGHKVLLHDDDAVEFEIGISGGKRNALDVILDPDASRKRFRGACSGWRYDKGFGFIKRADDSSDVFVHRDNLNGFDSLQLGDRVEFEVYQNPNNGKLAAIRVTRAEDPDRIQDGVHLNQSKEIKSKDQIMNSMKLKNDIKIDKERTVKTEAAAGLRVDVPTIKLRGKHGMQRAKILMKCFQDLTNDHKIHCHFVSSK